LIQYIKNADLIVKGKKLIGISNALRPTYDKYEYNIINNNKPKNQLEQFSAKVGGRKSSKRSSKLKF
jgi:hypothetical protein